MGADQALYAYIGDRILAGDLPYRDAWDQKPPAIHYTYAALRAIAPADVVVPAADLAVAALVAWLLVRLGSTIASRNVGILSSLIFLLLSNPAFTRLNGVRLRAQCETFIAMLVAGAFLLLARSGRGSSAHVTLGAGLLFGLAFAFKYNAGIFLAAGLVSLWLWRRLTLRDAALVIAGFAVPVLALLGAAAATGTLRVLFDATITYNLRYSGETYRGLSSVFTYLLAFPVQEARIDALWTLGGAGCIALIPAVLSGRIDRLVPVVWVGAACLSIAINGSRGYPQYFVQANPALALAAGLAAVTGWEWIRARWAAGARLVGVAAALVSAVAVWRVNQFPKLVEQTAFDLRYATGSLSRSDYLARYADTRKYSSLAATELGNLLRARSAPGETVYVFGFTCGAYVYAERASASRFFWSRPVIVEFLAGRDGYGSRGLLADLEHSAPAVVALQQRDWEPEVNSAEFFLSNAALAGWLQSRYDRSSGTEGFDVWVRRGATP